MEQGRIPEINTYSENPVARQLLVICLKKSQIESCHAEAGVSPYAGMRCSRFQYQELSPLRWGTGAICRSENSKQKTNSDGGTAATSSVGVGVGEEREGWGEVRLLGGGLCASRTSTALKVED